LEKVAEVLSVTAAEVNRLREQSKLRGFRDGTNWKFLKEDVHTYLAASIKARSGGANGAPSPSDSDFDLGGENASASSFDLLMEDAALPGDSDLVSVAPARPKSDLDLAALDQDELALAEETQISSLVVPKKIKTAAEPSSQIMPVENEDSSALLLAVADGGALDDEASVLGAGSSSPQLGLASESGFDVLVAGADEDLLQVDEEKTDVSAAPLAVEFTLEPSPAVPDDDASESSSQVIAIDVGFAAAEQSTDAFESDGFEDFVGFDSGIQQGPPPTNNDPFGTGASLDAAPVISVSPKKAAVAEEEYSTGILVALIGALVVMLLPGIMLLDTMIHMWSWSDPFILNSILMSTISGWFGL
jgi:hypothetical protein